MSTYLSKPYEASQFQPGIPLDLIMKVGMYKQAKYDQNLSNIQESLDRIGQYNIVKDSDRQVIGEKLQGAVNKINEFAGMDLSDARTYNQVLGVTSSLYNDEDVYKRIAANRNYTEQAKAIQDIKQNHPEQYNPDNEALFLKQAKAWMGDPTQTSFNDTYIPYHDTSKNEQALIKAVLEHPDTIQEINYNKDGSVRDRTERKFISTDKIMGVLNNGLSQQDIAQYRISYEANKDNYTMADVNKDISDKVKDNKDRIADLQYTLDTKSPITSQAESLQKKIKELGEENVTLEQQYNRIASSGNPLNYFTPTKYIKDRIYGIAANQSFSEQGETKADQYSLEDHKLGKDYELYKLKNQVDFEDDQRRQAAGLLKGKYGDGSSTGGTSSAPSDLTQFHLDDEYSTTTLNLAIRKEATGSPRVVASYLNSPDKDPDAKTGTFNITLDGENVAFNYASTLTSQGITVPDRKAQGYILLNEQYKRSNAMVPTSDKPQYTDVVSGKDDYNTVVRLLKEGYIPVVPKDLSNEKRGMFQDHWKAISKKLADGTMSEKELTSYPVGKYYNPSIDGNRRKMTMSEFAQALASGKKTGVKIFDNSMQSIKDKFEKDYGLDLSNPADVRQAEEISKNATIDQTSIEVGNMLKDKKFAGRFKVSVPTSDNLFTGTDGSPYAKVYAQMTRNEFDSRMGDYGYKLGDDGAARNLWEKGVINQAGVDDEGNTLVQVPLIIKIKKDLVQGMKEYLSLHKGEKVFGNMDNYAQQLYTGLDAAKKISVPEVRDSIIAAARKKVEDSKSTSSEDNYNIAMSHINDAANILSNQNGAYDPISMIKAYGFLEKAVGWSAPNQSSSSLTPRFKVTGEAGLNNIHPWAMEIGNSIADILGPTTTFNSVFRTTDTNARAGGKEGSYHLQGAGIDIPPDEWDKIPKDKRDRILNDYEAQVINEGNHIHIEPNSRSVLNRYAESAMTIASSHNNPGNIKWAPWMTKYGAIAGSDSTDGGLFAKFPDIETGLAVQKKLLFDEDTIYSNMTVDQALKSYSHNGYNAGDIYPSISSKSMSKLTTYEKDELVRRILKKEDTNLYKKLVQQNRI